MPTPEISELPVGSDALVLPLLEGVLVLRKDRPVRSIHCNSPRCGDDHRDVMSGICKTETRIQNVTAIIEDMLWHHNGKRVRLTLEILGENAKGESQPPAK